MAKAAIKWCELAIAHIVQSPYSVSRWVAKNRYLPRAPWARIDGPHLLKDSPKLHKFSWKSRTDKRGNPVLAVTCTVLPGSSRRNGGRVSKARYVTRYGASEAEPPSRTLRDIFSTGDAVARIEFIRASAALPSVYGRVQGDYRVCALALPIAPRPLSSCRRLHSLIT